MHVHHFLFPPPDGSVSIGYCKDESCKEIAVGKNSTEALGSEDYVPADGSGKRIPKRAAKGLEAALKAKRANKEEEN